MTAKSRRSYVEALGERFDRTRSLKYVVSGAASFILVLAGGLIADRIALGVTLAVVGLISIEGATYAYDRYTVREDARKTLRQALVNLLMYLEQSIPVAERSLRANLMLVDGDALRIAYRVGEYDDGEIRMAWHKPQGCCGTAWDRGHTVFAPIDMEPPELPINPNDPKTVGIWSMSEEQRKVSSTIGAVISVPVRREQAGKIVGVLNVDDQKRVEDSVLSKTDQATVETFGCSIPPLLERAGYDIPRTADWRVG